MGGGSSTPSTPLACMLKGFDNYFNKAKYRVPYPPATRERLQYLCQQIGPHMGVGWPPEGTFKDQIIGDLFALVAANEEQYPNQYQYIDQWQTAVDEQADDLLQCQAEMVRLCVARPKGKGKGKKLNMVTKRVKDVKVSETKVSDTKKEMLIQEEETILRPPPYAPQPPAPGAPPLLPQAAAGDGDENDEAGGSEVADPGAKPKTKRRPKKGKAARTAKVEEEVTDSEEEDDEGEGGIEIEVGVMTRARAAKAEAVAAEAQDEFMAPLRQMDQQVVNPQGVVEYRPCFQYIPFSTTDLLNWKQHYGPLTTKPTEMADLFQTIMQTHNPNW
ncbi:uncharacterized protein LOC131192796 [Ahaetulla prasina]|uniref:uncharacterized protein LOC131192796 n=1 Tax=Ahaetulla prasina TaxID=499056 RepID=UPI0026498556|nr:uncharacterized protein LOC131192796 [Ahaetulla prasina]XP_058028305.1 uncharacterized protein LOC131192796 [Ahaetulla prasina]XP_058028306.1 uncharacterized protein LOC131192796 [Ahaetulla prasina]XP_058028307.1 uncharacterized protein LOC131192796 [Ahaetulla prasina]